MNKKIIYLTCTMFLMSLLANMGHPVTPELVVSLKMSSFMYGVMFAAMSIAGFVMSPIWGSLSDKYKDRRLFMYIPTIGYGLAQLGFGFSTSVPMIIFFRILGGAFSSSVFTNAIAYIIDETNLEERNKAIANYTAITGFGVSIGYLAGGYIGAKDYHYAFAFQAAGLLIHAVLMRLFLPKSQVHSKAQETSQENLKGSLKASFKTYLSTSLGVLLLIVLLTSFSNTTYSNGINYYLKKYLNLNPLQIGYYMAFTGIIGMIANIYLTPRLSRKIGDKKSLKYVFLAIGISLMIIGMQANILAKSTIGVFVLFIFVLSMFNPLLQAMVSKHSENEHGRIMGLQSSINSVGMVGGSLFSGALMDSYPKVSFMVAAALFLISYLIVQFNRRLSNK
ncbi:MFS transporter [Clostridium sp. UBA4548]|uniref:MFS transporter n=1 Tax=Clostridium sp. UBA4548 TaxID=1946361 RepID=UPI0025C16B5B|nr:MFS transporter [Clostridium sp. UBA4548]